MWFGTPNKLGSGEFAARQLITRPSARPYGASSRGWSGLNGRRNRHAATNALRRLSIRSITFDTGSEFSDYPVIAKALRCNIYFADTLRPWQRGTRENTIGLVRQYVPKGTLQRLLAPRGCS